MHFRNSILNVPKDITDIIHMFIEHRECICPIAHEKDGIIIFNGIKLYSVGKLI